MTELGRHATITLPAISESVDGLVAKGLLIRRANERDRRESHLLLTEAGREALREATTLLAGSAQRILRGVPESRRATLARDLRAVKEEATDALIDSRSSPESERD